MFVIRVLLEVIDAIRAPSTPHDPWARLTFVIAAGLLFWIVGHGLAGWWLARGRAGIRPFLTFVLGFESALALASPFGWLVIVPFALLLVDRPRR